MEAVQARYLEGVSALPYLMRHLFDHFDANCTFEELHTQLEFMVIQRGDLCAYLHRWLQGRIAQPQPDYRSILFELGHMLKCYGKV